MGKRIVFKDVEARLWVWTPTIPDIDRVLSKLPPGATDVHVIDSDIVPVDRSYRDAWDFDGEKFVIDMPAAREIHRNKLREARRPLLAALDIEYQRADEAGDVMKKQQIAAQKRTLRDVPADPAIEAAQTPEELKAVWPVVLIDPV